MNLIKGDCIIELKKLPDKSIDFFYLDLPYGQTACKWDVKIDHKALWIELRRLAKSERTPFFFSCTTKFGFDLYNSAPKGWFRWDLVWKKNRAAGFLNAYKLPMRKHEMIYCFAKKSPEYDVSSHLTGDTEIGTNCKNHKFLKSAIGERKSFNKDHIRQVLKDPLPTSDITPPTDEHELVYCFAKKTPEYDVSSHLTGEEIERSPSKNNKYLTEFQNKGSMPTYEKPHKSKVLSEPLPTSDITPPTDEHELVYCFAKKCPDYDVSSHKDKKVIEYTHHTKRDDSNQYNLNEKKEGAIKNIHKDPLPNSDITPPTDEHELVYCFAKKTPEYDVSSHLTGEEKTRKPSINDKYLTQFQNKGSLPTYEKPHTSKVLSKPLPTSDITPSSWCEYKLDTKIDHRTAKPVKLMEFLLKYWTKEGDTVCDPTAGSGSMGVACKNMNRKFIGIEKDDDIYTLMCDRIENHQKKMKEEVK